MKTTIAWRALQQHGRESIRDRIKFMSRVSQELSYTSAGGNTSPCWIWTGSRLRGYAMLSLEYVDAAGIAHGTTLFASRAALWAFGAGAPAMKRPKFIENKDGTLKLDAVQKPGTWWHRTAVTPELQAGHLCQNGRRGCVNPRHLYAQTAAENRAQTVREQEAGVRPPRTAPYKRSNTRHPRDRMVCLRGHELSGENVYIIPSTGARNCRACKTMPRAKLLLAPVFGHRRPRSRRRFSAMDIQVIRAWDAGGEFTQEQIAESFGCDSSTIGRIVRRNTNADVPDMPIRLQAVIQNDSESDRQRDSGNSLRRSAHAKQASLVRQAC